MICYPLELNKLQFCILNNQRITRVQVPSAVLPLTANSIPVCMALGTPHHQGVKSSIPPSVPHSPPASRNSKALPEPRSRQKKGDKVGDCNNSVIVALHNQERKPRVWHWNQCWEDVSLSSQDLGSPSVTQTVRDSQGQPGTVRTQAGNG